MYSTANCILVIVTISIGQALILHPSDEAVVPKLNNSLVSASTSVQSGYPKWRVIFKSDGKEVINVPTLMKVCGTVNVYKDDIIRFTFGQIKDYMRPIETTTLCDFLTKYKTADGKVRTYLWSASETGTYRAVTWGNPDLLGMSTRPPVDDRDHLNTWGWGTDRNDINGGCCWTANRKYGGQLSVKGWGIPVTIELQTKHVFSFQHIHADGYVTVGGELNVVSAIHASQDVYVGGNIHVNGKVLSDVHAKVVDVEALRTENMEVLTKFVAGSDNTMANLTVSQSLTAGSAVISQTLFANGGIRNTNPAVAVNIGKINTSNISASGHISCNSLHVLLGGHMSGPDFVFDESYSLMSLSETEEFINTNRHLPGVKSAVDMKSNGIDIGQFQLKLLQKIEELTLHSIQMKKHIEELTLHSIHTKKHVTDLEKKIEKLKA